MILIDIYTSIKREFWKKFVIITVIYPRLSVCKPI